MLPQDYVTRYITQNNKSKIQIQRKATNIKIYSREKKFPFCRLISDQYKAIVL